MKKRLSVIERLVLLNLLPKEGTFANLKLIRVARESLSFNDIENQKLKFVQTGEQVHWDMKGAVDIDAHFEIEIGDTVTQLVIDELKKLDKEGKLTDEHFSLYEKFII